jgi:UDP-N-acetylglucosamine--N-acetylmuramyl-(pentapeptide) pyrophosphoryl-undecaprenol N-acetylglucosamine transferase
VIFATVGSHPTYRFERFLRALEALPPSTELVVQFGPGEAPSNATRAVPWMTFAEIVEHMERAEHVVSHAGAGTILCASGVGQVPIVFPRLQRFGETVDDHQVELARRLAEDGRLVVVESAPELLAAVASAPPRGAEAALEAGAELIAAVRAEFELSG